MLQFLKAPFLVLHFSYYSLMTFLMMLSVIATYADDTTLCSKCDQASDLWQRLDLASKLGRKWLLEFSAGKTQLVSFHWSNNSGAINVKMDRSGLEEKSSFKILGLTFYSKYNWGSYIISIAKTAPKKIGAFIRSM